jgi:hypothetical protein
MGFNGVVEIDKATKFNVSVQRVFKLNALVPHLHNSTNDALCLSISNSQKNKTPLQTEWCFRGGDNRTVM